MAKKKIANVTMRVRIGESELEVTGPSDFVEGKIADFVNLNKQTPLTRPYSREGSSTSTNVKTAASGKAVAPAQFFRNAGAKTDVDRALAAGYYLERQRNVQSFTANEIKEIMREARQNLPKNTNESINANIRKGLMMSAGDKDNLRAFVLTSDGEDAVIEMLQK